MPPVPPITRNLLIAMLVGFVLQQLLSVEWTVAPFALWPLGSFGAGIDAEGMPRSVGFQPWQLVSYAFLHGDFMHLLLNAFGLWQFGSRVEQALGDKRFLQLFFVSVVGAGLCQLAVVSAMAGSGEGAFPTVGASGGVFGILIAYAVMFPRDQVVILPIPVPMSSRTMVLIFGAVTLLAGITGTMQGVAHFAHLGGMLFGWLLLRYWRGQPPFRKRRPPPPRRVW